MQQNNPKKRLFIVSSLFTTAVVGALIKQFEEENVENYLVSIAPILYENLDNHIKIASEQLGVFKQVSFYFDFCQPKKNFKEEKKHVLSFDVKKFKDSIGNVEFDEIYSVYIHGAANYLFNQYPNADLFFVEDGTAAYLKMENSELINKRAKKIYTINYFDKIVPYISSYENVPTVQINKDILKEVFENLSAKIKFNLEQKDKVVIFCAQNISMSQIAMTYHEELMMYERHIRRLLSMGYFVYFKEHPKTPNMFFRNLSPLINNPNFANVGAYAVLPMETLVYLLKPCAVVSMFSSALFTVPWLFDIPSFTFFSNEDFKKHPIFEIAHMLVASFVPSIELIHQNPEITKQNFDIYISKIKHIENQAYYRIKNINFFKLFISRKEFYAIKRECRKESKWILKYFSIPTDVLDIFRNKSYFDYLKYYFDDFKAQYAVYKNAIVKRKDKSLKLLIEQLKDAIIFVIKNLL